MASPRVALDAVAAAVDPCRLGRDGSHACPDDRHGQRLVVRYHHDITVADEDVAGEVRITGDPVALGPVRGDAHPRGLSGQAVVDEDVRGVVRVARHERVGPGVERDEPAIATDGRPRGEVVGLNSAEPHADARCLTRLPIVKEDVWQAVGIARPGGAR